MTVDITRVLETGGEERVALLRYGVMSVTPEPMFVFVVQQYRLRPTPVAVQALHDVFCMAGAPARVRCPAVLPPRDLHLTAASEAIRRQQAWLASPSAEREATGGAITVPHKHLFDRVVAALRADPEGPLARVSEQYDPARAPLQNLPGGRMNAAQKHFVEKVWRPIVRPKLVAAGFWQVANIE